jgi:hypothetical protein
VPYAVRNTENEPAVLFSYSDRPLFLANKGRCSFVVDVCRSSAPCRWT